MSPSVYFSEHTSTHEYIQRREKILQLDDGLGTRNSSSKNNNSVIQSLSAHLYADGKSGEVYYSTSRRSPKQLKKKKRRSPASSLAVLL